MGKIFRRIPSLFWFLLILVGAAPLIAQDPTIINLDSLPPASSAEVHVARVVDSAIVAAYADTTNNGLCMVVQDHRPEYVRITDVRPYGYPTSCPLDNGVFAFVRDTEVTRANLVLLDGVVIVANPHLLIVCGGRRIPHVAVPFCWVRKEDLR